jgi:hypothetical protein
VRASTVETEDPPTAEDKGGPVIDRLDVSTWGYDRIEGDT